MKLVGPHEGLTFHLRYLDTRIIFIFSFHNLLLQLKHLHMELSTAILKHWSGGLEGGPAPIERAGGFRSLGRSCIKIIHDRLRFIYLQNLSNGAGRERALISIKNAIQNEFVALE